MVEHKTGGKDLKEEEPFSKDTALLNYSPRLFWISFVVFFLGVLALFHFEYDILKIIWEYLTDLEKVFN